jgi:succinylglutamate desuccinylase
MTVKIVTYRALEAGTALTVLGAVHGNERCGAESINRLIADIDSGAVALKRGILRLIPVTNPNAYAKRVRFVERNLNRYLYPKEEKVHYEDHLDPIICGVLDETDILLDLHSYTAEGGPFIFLGGHNAKEIAYARSLGVSNFVWGWTEAFGTGNAQESQGTTEYARTRGALAATLECGNHDNADAPDIGYRAILLAMAHFEMLDESCLSTLSLDRGQSSGKQRCIQMKSVHRREEGAAFAKKWRHFDFVAKGEAIASLPGGKTVAASEDSFIVLPNDKTAAGDVWFYLGTETQFPA